MIDRLTGVPRTTAALLMGDTLPMAMGPGHTVPAARNGPSCIVGNVVFALKETGI